MFEVESDVVIFGAFVKEDLIDVSPTDGVDALVVLTIRNRLGRSVPVVDHSRVHRYPVPVTDMLVQSSLSQGTQTSDMVTRLETL